MRTTDADQMANARALKNVPIIASNAALIANGQTHQQPCHTWIGNRHAYALTNPGPTAINPSHADIAQCIVGMTNLSQVTPAHRADALRPPPLHAIPCARVAQGSRGPQPKFALPNLPGPWLDTRGLPGQTHLQSARQRVHGVVSRIGIGQHAGLERQPLWVFVDQAVHLPSNPSGFVRPALWQDLL